ncbi:hypothetical protein GCM10009616_19750 [Microlunatus lacustris]
MPTPAADLPDPGQSPVTGSDEVPVPRLGTPATETTEDSLRAERDHVGDHPDTGGLTSTDDAQ